MDDCSLKQEGGISASPSATVSVALSAHTLRVQLSVQSVSECWQLKTRLGHEYKYLGSTVYMDCLVCCTDVGAKPHLCILLMLLQLHYLSGSGPFVQCDLSFSMCV